MLSKAVLRKLRISPQKLNLVAQQIRGKKVDKADTVLKFSNKRAAIDVLKTLRSAVANAENNYGLDIDSLVVSEAYVGQSITMKRFQPRAKGRAGKIKKYFSHLTIVLKEQKD
jgi:large subunit ribosomal protein L22